MRKYGPEPSLWTQERLEKLRNLYNQGATLAEIVQALNLLNKQQVSNRISEEIRRGRLVKRPRCVSKRTKVSNAKWGGDGHTITEQVVCKKIGSYAENGKTVNVYERGFAIGAAPDPSVKNRH